MAITYHNQYVLQGGTTALTMVPPASTAAGDLDIIYVANKNSSVTPTNPSGGWTLLDSQVVGTGADGVGTGQIRLTAWYRILSGASTNTSVTITGANRSLGGGMVYRKGGGDTWGTPSISFGSDITSGTAFSAPMAANLGVLVGEWLLSVGVFTNIVALNGRDQTIPGMTFTSTGINSAGGATGNHIFLFTDHTSPSAGTQTGVSTTVATGGAAVTGGALNIRVGLQTTTPVSSTRATTWDVLSTVTSTRAVSYDVLSSVAPTRAAIWDTLAAVTSSRATSWAVRSAVVSSRSTTWRVAARITSTRAALWDVLASVGSTRATSWRVLSLTTGQRSTSWRVLAGTLSTRAASWRVAARTTATRAASWRVLAQVLGTRSTTWDVDSPLGTVVSTRSTTWGVAGSVTSVRGASWRVLQPITDTRATSWDVRAAVQSVRATEWRTLAQPNSSRNALWAVLTQVTSERSTTWQVLSDIPDRDLTLSGTLATQRFVSVVEGNRFLGAILPGRWKGEVKWQ